MTENLSTIVKSKNGMKFLAETKNNYLLPIGDAKAMCILLNYALRNQDIPNTDTLGWENNSELQEYYREEEWHR